MQSNKICYNGTFLSQDEPVLLASNKSYRYGSGFFETIKVIKSQIILSPYHKKRIEDTCTLLHYHLAVHTTIEKIFEAVLKLCDKNNCSKLARVRLSFSNSSGGLFENNNLLDYLIEAWPLEASTNALNENGLKTGIFQFIKKGCDIYSNLKSSSALIYSVAAQFSKEQGWNDCIILNTTDKICESSIANIFWVKDKKLFTPPLSDGCISGVMRSYLLNTIKTVVETSCTIHELQNADEVFVTNAIRGIRWIKSIDNNEYACGYTRNIYEQYIQPLNL